MTFPVALVILVAANWTVMLVLALIAGALGAYLQGGWRVVWFAVAGILLATLALGLPLLMDWQSPTPR